MAATHLIATQRARKTLCGKPVANVPPGAGVVRRSTTKVVGVSTDGLAVCKRCEKVAA